MQLKTFGTYANICRTMQCKNILKYAKRCIFSNMQKYGQRYKPDASKLQAYDEI